MNIAEIMTTDVTVVGPETSVANIARKMRDANVGALPVVENDRILGMVTDRDIVVRGIADSRDPDATSARDVMSNDVVVCYESQTTREVAEKMGDVHVRRFVVLDSDDNLVGMVSLGDLSEHGRPASAGEAMQKISEAPPKPA